MIVVVRYVLSVNARVDGALIGEINAGLLLYTGFKGLTLHQNASMPLIKL
ncbi:D-aminoacyl-tRNA deacylase [Brevinema andersonii]|nr:hypothetical protein [Brevinema andersonii]